MQRINPQLGAMLDGLTNGGERDVMRYAVTRMADFAPGVWTNVQSIPAGGVDDITDVGLATNVTYSYAVAVQDCTPAYSPPVSSNPVKPN